jgi:hypothetical protein
MSQVTYRRSNHMRRHIQRLRRRATVSLNDKTVDPDDRLLERLIMQRFGDISDAFDIVKPSNRKNMMPFYLTLYFIVAEMPVQLVERVPWAATFKCPPCSLALRDRVRAMWDDCVAIVGHFVPMLPRL